MKKSGFKCSRFTLVELLVAMGIFCLLLMVSMQIFGGAQKLWVSSEQKNNVFASARTAMEFIASRIQTNAYSEDMPFAIYEKETVNSVTSYKKIFFPTAMPMNRVKADGTERDRQSMRFIGFQLKSDGVLEMRIYSDEGNRAFFRNLPPYTRNTSSAAYTDVKGKMDADSPSEYNTIEIAEFVTSFRIVPYNLDGDAANAPVKRDTDSSELKAPPYLLEIEISMIDSKANYEKWVAADANGKKEIEQECGYTFRRAVLLGDRRNR